MTPTPEDWARLAEAFKERRKERGHPKRAPFARELDIDDSTLAIIEGARSGPVSDDMRDFVATKLGWAPGMWRQILAGATRPIGGGHPTEAQTIIEALADDLDPRLTEFTDDDLVAEIRTRMLLMAVKLGNEALEWRADEGGLPELVSRITKRRE